MMVRKARFGSLSIIQALNFSIYLGSECECADCACCCVGAKR